MPSANKVFLIGNLTRDPELKQISDKASVCSFGLAVNDRWTTESGEKRESVMFIDCQAWNRMGEVIHQYVRKGNPLYVEGKLKLDQWDKDGAKHSKHTITVEKMQLLGDNRNNEQKQDQPTSEGDLQF